MKFLVALLVVVSGSFWSIDESVAQKTIEGSKSVESKQQDQPYLGLMFNKEGVLKPVPNSPAEKAGIQTGDVVLQVDGEKVAEAAMLEKKFQTKKMPLLSSKFNKEEAMISPILALHDHKPINTPFLWPTNQPLKIPMMPGQPVA